MEIKDIFLVLGPFLGFLTPTIVALVTHQLNKKRVQQEQRAALIEEFMRLIRDIDGKRNNDTGGVNTQVTAMILLKQLGEEHEFLLLPAYRMLLNQKGAFERAHYDTTFINVILEELKLKIDSKYHNFPVDPIIRI